MQPTKFAPSMQPMQAGPQGTSGKAMTGLLLSVASMLCSCLTAIPGLIFGIIALSDISKSNGRLKGKGMAITAIILAVVFPVINLTIAISIMFYTLKQAGQEFVAAVEAAQGEANASTVKADHQQIGLAMNNYHDANRKYPGSESSNQNALSWRVHVLPYLDENGLFQEFDMNQEFNVGQNAALTSEIPSTFYAPQIDFPEESTPYLAPVSVPGSSGPKYGFEEGAKLSDMFDGASNVVLVLYCDKSTAVFPWSQNRDLAIEPTDPTLGMERVGNYYMVLMADGSSKRVKSDVVPEVMLQLLQRNDGNVIPFGTLEDTVSDEGFDEGF